MNITATWYKAEPASCGNQNDKINRRMIVRSITKTLVHKKGLGRIRIFAIWSCYFTSTPDEPDDWLDISFLLPGGIKAEISSAETIDAVKKSEILNTCKIVESLSPPEHTNMFFSLVLAQYEANKLIVIKPKIFKPIRKTKMKKKNNKSNL